MRWLWKGWQRVWPGLLLAGAIAGLLILHGGSDGKALGWHRPAVFDDQPLEAVGQAVTAGPEWPVASPARNVILVIGDGLGFGQVLAGRAAVGGSTAAPLSFERWPVHTTMTTNAPGLVVTGSAAAASTMATGVKVPYRGVAACADGRPLRSLTEYLADRGFRAVVASDTRLLDATPAGFAAHAAARGDHEDIARTMAASPVEVFVGVEGYGLLDGGADHWSFFEEAGVRRVETLQELSGTGTDERVALIAKEGGDEGLQVDELAEALLPLLDDGSRPFFLMIETEEPDTASHRYDLERLQRGVARLTRAVGTLERWATARGDTLLVVTGDHETSGLVPTGGRVGQPLRVVWSAGYHTALPVPLWARGPGAAALASVRDNADLAGGLAVGVGQAPFTPSEPCPLPQ